MIPHFVLNTSKEQSRDYSHDSINQSELILVDFSHILPISVARRSGNLTRIMSMKYGRGAAHACHRAKNKALSMLLALPATENIDTCRVCVVVLTSIDNGSYQYPDHVTLNHQAPPECIIGVD
jgi:hypothetical protein